MVSMQTYRPGTGRSACAFAHSALARFAEVLHSSRKCAHGPLRSFKTGAAQGALRRFRNGAVVSEGCLHHPSEALLSSVDSCSAFALDGCLHHCSGGVVGPSGGASGVLQGHAPRLRDIHGRRQQRLPLLLLYGAALLNASFLVFLVFTARAWWTSRRPCAWSCTSLLAMGLHEACSRRGSGSSRWPCAWG